MTDIASSSAASFTPTPAAPPPPPREQTMVLRECPICQSSIYPAEETLPCPKCGLVFHAECWQENLGCASYGCDQVNALAPKIDIPAAQQVELPPPIDAPIEPLPWDFLLLGGSALAMAASMLSYGLPSLLALAGVSWRMYRKRAYHNRILIAAVVLCVIGIVGGIALSRFWFTQIDYGDAGGVVSDAGGIGADAGGASAG
jgi:hypothetical protein